MSEIVAQSICFFINELRPAKYLIREDTRISSLPLSKLPLNRRVGDILTIKEIPT